MGTGRSGLNKRSGGLLPGLKDISHKVDSDKYKVFRDKASGTHTYDGSGREVTKFFDQNSNYDELINSLTRDEIRAFIDWASGTFMGSNKSSFGNLTSREQDMLRVYDKILDKAQLNDGIVVRRLASFSLVNSGSRAVPSTDALVKMEGNLINVGMPLSTSAAAQGLTIGARGKNVEYVIHIPKGSTGAGMWIGDHRINHWGPQQREFMVNRDTIFRQGKTTYNSSRGIYEVELFYVGRSKHKYK